MSSAASLPISLPDTLILVKDEVFCKDFAILIVFDISIMFSCILKLCSLALCDKTAAMSSAASLPTLLLATLNSSRDEILCINSFTKLSIIAFSKQIFIKRALFTFAKTIAISFDTSQSVLHFEINSDEATCDPIALLNFSPSMNSKLPLSDTLTFPIPSPSKSVEK